MPSKRVPGKQLGSAVSAKAEVGAHASYSVEKKVTQVVPVDVTRSRNTAWLDLISPITEWAGLKGDELKGKRAVLRIEQEATLQKFAELTSEKLQAAGKIRNPIPAKVLVPLLEKASLERPSDDYMVERWANLIVSSATSGSPHPLFVDLLSKITGDQARMLEKMAIGFRDADVTEPFDGLLFEANENLMQRKIDAILRNPELKGRHSDAVFDLLSGPGLYPIRTSFSAPDLAVNFPKLT
jgi:hypothetical protein